MGAEDQGPQASEEAGKARDGEAHENGNGGKSVAEQAQEPMIPPPPPLPGDKNLTLAGLGKTRNIPIENRVSLMAASTEAEGLFDPEVEGQLVVTYEPAGFDYKPVRKDGKVVRWKLIQQLRVKSVTKVTPEIAAAIQVVMEEHEMEATPA
jgi:hypothetical protein